MSQTRLLFVISIPAAVVFGLWGYVYEASYFFARGLNVHEYFGLRQFVLSGLRIVLPMLAILLVYTQLKKFFTKQVHEDDAKVLAEQLSKTSFSQQLIGARVAVGFSAAYWLIVVFAPMVGLTWPLWSSFGYMSFVNLLFFYGAFALSPPYSRLSVIVAFCVSVALCFSAGGYGYGQDTRVNDHVVRNDVLVKITQTDNAQVVEVKPLPEFPPLPRVVKKLFQ